jgi:hypothetical protein
MICTVDQQVTYVTVGGYAQAANNECVWERAAVQISIRKEWTWPPVTVTPPEYWNLVSDNTACDYF